jgi:hypothetical protein
MRLLIDERERKVYPNLPNEFPDSWFNEEWAQQVHSQTLKRLNERGGLCPQEMVCNIEHLNNDEYRKLTLDMAVKKLMIRLEK